MEKKNSVSIFLVYLCPGTCGTVRTEGGGVEAAFVNFVFGACGFSGEGIQDSNLPSGVVRRNFFFLKKKKT